MRAPPKTVPIVAAVVMLAACGGEAASTREIEAAAIERARAELKLPANTPLKATVWTGQEHEGALTFCGTVQGSGDGGAIRPQRFVAAADPFRFLVFEDAHAPMRPNDHGKFVEWSVVCPGEQSV